MSSRMKVSICIINYNRCQETLRCIESALKSEYQPSEIVFADNGSTDDSWNTVITNFGLKIKSVRFDRNYGCPGGRNRAVAHCSGEYIFFLDNDALLGVKTIATAIETIENNSQIVVVTGKYTPFNDLKDVYLFKETNNNRFIGSVAFFIGGCSLLRRSEFVRAGGFPDDYIYGGEEAYFALRMLELGKLIVYDSGILVWHKMSELARDYVWEQNRTARNSLRTVLTLAPHWMIPLLVFNHVCKYAIDSWKMGYFKPWVLCIIKDMIANLPLTIKSRRLSSSAWYKRILLNRCNLCPVSSSFSSTKITFNEFLKALFKGKSLN